MKNHQKKKKNILDVKKRRKKNEEIQFNRYIVSAKEYKKHKINTKLLWLAGVK